MVNKIVKHNRKLICNKIKSYIKRIKCNKIDAIKINVIKINK